MILTTISQEAEQVFRMKKSNKKNCETYKLNKNIVLQLRTGF